MGARYVCLICRRELPSQDVGCPHCRSAAPSQVGASPPTLAATFVVLIAMLLVTGYVAGTFHEAEVERGQRHAARGETLAAVGDFDRSIDQYREALSYIPDSTEYQLQLAVALYETGRSEEAASRFEELLAADPTLAEANLYLARLAEARADLDQAAQYYRTAIYGHWPSDPVSRRIETRFELVALLERRGEQTRALTELGELLTEEPDSLVVANRAAWSLLNAGSPGSALAVFERLTERDPDNAVAHWGVAEAEFELHHYLTARTHFRRALTLNRDLTHLQSRLRLTDEINAIDPTVRGLGRASRYDRSLTLTRRAVAALDTCLGPGSGDVEGDAKAQVDAAEVPQVPAELERARTRAHAWLEGSDHPRDDDTIDANLVMAEQLWQAARERCGDTDAADEALARVLAKIDILTSE